MGAPSPSQKSRRGPGRPRKLTHAQIVEAATRVIEEGGIQSLTMRAVAARLNVIHATLYTYFKHIDDIAQAVLEDAARGLPIPDESRPLPLRDQLVEFFMAQRELQLRLPGALMPAVGTSAWRFQMQVVEKVLQLITARGVNLEQASIAFRTLSALVAFSAQQARAAAGSDDLPLDASALMEMTGGRCRTVVDALSSNYSRPARPALALTLNYLLDRLLPEISS